MNPADVDKIVDAIDRLAQAVERQTEVLREPEPKEGDDEPETVSRG